MLGSPFCGWANTKPEILIQHRITFPLALGISGIIILCSLGTWQLQRLQWKQQILTEIETEIAAAPVAIPGNPNPDRDNYLSVMASGDIRPGELLVLLSRPGFGPGYRVIVPFETNGRRVLLDRGFTSHGNRPDIRPPGSAAVIGNLHWPDETDRLFTPSPDGNLWFSRDVQAMANFLETEPLLIVAREVEPAAAQIIPWPVDSRAVPNNHRNYAITWFLLAAAWCAMTIFWLWKIKRNPSE